MCELVLMITLALNLLLGLHAQEGGDLHFEVDETLGLLRVEERHQQDQQLEEEQQQQSLHVGEEDRRLEKLRAELREEERRQQSGAIPGEPGVDYPAYSRVPKTSFTCSDKLSSGYYADIGTRCQVFHVCGAGGAMHSFLCPVGSVFNQQFLVCDWWHSTACGEELLTLTDFRDLARLQAHPKLVEQNTHSYLPEAENDTNTSPNYEDIFQNRVSNREN